MRRFVVCRGMWPIGSARVFLVSLAVCGLIGLAACCSSGGAAHFKPVRFEHQADAGSARVSVLSVAPWDDTLAAELQPSFSITAKQALEEVVPTSMLEEEKLLDLLKTVVRLATPSTSTTSTTTQTEGDDEPGDDDETQGGGELEVSDTHPGDRLASGQPGRENVLQGTVGMDPMLRHTLAAAYYQEVKILNRYVRDAAVRTDYHSYLVRLQVSLMPRARNAPYDAYTTISFFPHGAGKENGVINKGVDGGAPVLESEACGGINDVQPASGTGSLPFFRAYCRDGGAFRNTGYGCEAARRYAQDMLNYLKCNDLSTNCETPCGFLQSFLDKEKCATARAPIVLPLLVTDSLESAFGSRSTDRVRQSALALSAMIESIGFGQSFEKLSERLLSTVGTDYNSLYTVSRLTDNTLQVRFGALLQHTAHYAMVNHTRNVSVLLMVPDEIPSNSSIDIMARTEFVDAETGKPLPYRTDAELTKARERVFRDFFPMFASKSEKLMTTMTTPGRADQKRMLQDVSLNRYPDFLEACTTSSDEHDGAGCNQAWVALTSLSVGSQFSATSFPLHERDVDLPECESKEFFPAIDDGEKTMTVTVGGGNGLRASELAAALEVKKDDDDGTIVSLPSDSIAVSPRGDTVTVRFPSLARVEYEGSTLAKKIVKNNDWTPKLRLSRLGDDKRPLYALKYVVVRSKPAEPDPGLKIKCLPAIRTEPDTAEQDFEMVITPTKKGTSQKVTVTFEFTKAGGGAASGKATNIKQCAFCTNPSLNSAINELMFTFNKNKDKKGALKVHFKQLENGSTMKIKARLKGSKTLVTKEVAISVPPKPKGSGTAP